jgi:hypothetical protein
MFCYLCLDLAGGSQPGPSGATSNSQPGTSRTLTFNLGGPLMNSQVPSRTTTTNSQASTVITSVAGHRSRTNTTHSRASTVVTQRTLDLRRLRNIDRGCKFLF